MAKPVKNLAGREWNEPITAGRNHWYSAKVTVVDLYSQTKSAILTSPNLFISWRNEDRAKGAEGTNDGQ